MLDSLLPAHFVAGGILKDVAMIECRIPIMGCVGVLCHA